MRVKIDGEPPANVCDLVARILAAVRRRNDAKRSSCRRFFRRDKLRRLLRCIEHMQSVEGFILVGGKSRRMGRDKSRLTFDGHRFVDLISNELSRVASTVTLVGSHDEQEKLPFIPDVHPEWGALGGVQAALVGCSEELALVVACDFPFVTSDLFTKIIELSGDFEAVAPIQDDGIPQPLCSLYRVDPCRQRADDLIKSGERRPIALLQSVETRWLQFNEIAGLKNASRFFDNINTPEDYARITHERI